LSFEFKYQSVGTETFEKCSILFKFKEGEYFNHRNTFSILRIKIWAWHRNWAKGGVLQRSRTKKGWKEKNMASQKYYYLDWMAVSL